MGKGEGGRVQLDHLLPADWAHLEEADINAEMIVHNVI